MSQTPVPDHAKTLMANEASVGTTRRVVPGAPPVDAPAPAPLAEPAAVAVPSAVPAPEAPSVQALVEPVAAPVAAPEAVYLPPEVQETPQVSIQERMTQLNDLHQGARDQLAALEAALKK